MKWRETISVSVSWLRNEARLVWGQRVETLSDIVHAGRSRNALDGNSDPTKWSITKSLLRMGAVTTILIFVSAIFLLMLPMVGVLAMLRRKEKEYVVPKASKWYRTFPYLTRQPAVRIRKEGDVAPPLETYGREEL